MHRGPSQVVNIGWVPPSTGCLKLNVDGARNSGVLTTTGGLIRDDFGNWVRGFHRVMPCSDGDLKFFGFVTLFWGQNYGLLEMV